MKSHVWVGFFVAFIAVIGMTSHAPTAQELTDNVNVPAGEVALGGVNIPRAVMANGQALSAGDYTVHLTAQEATPPAVGALSVLERWVEFRQGGNVQGREVVSIVPNDEVADVAKAAPPASGSARVEMLRENEYMRVWINQAGTSYLIHLVVG